MVGTVGDRGIRMVRIFSILFILAIMSIALQSVAQEQVGEQETEEEADIDTRKIGKHYLAVKAGQNFSWLNLDPTVDQNMVRGPVIGISYNYMSQHFAGLLVEGLFIKYGWEEVFLDSMSTYSRELTYLEVPVLSNFIIGKKKTHLKLQLGPKIAMLLNDVETADVAEEQQQYYHGLEIEDKFELGLAVGLSLSRLFSFGELQADARFNMSFSNLFTTTDDLSLLYSQNQAITASVYYWFKVR